MISSNVKTNTHFTVSDKLGQETTFPLKNGVGFAGLTVYLSQFKFAKTQKMNPCTMLSHVAVL